MQTKQFLCFFGLSAMVFNAALGAELVQPTNRTPNFQPFRPTLNPEANFTEAQSKAYHEALESSRTGMSNLWQKVRLERRDLEKLASSEKIDESAIRRLAGELGKTEGDLALLKAQTLARLRPLFSTEQIERLARSPQLNGAPYMAPRRIGTNEMNLRPRTQRAPEAAPAPKLAPLK